MKMNKKTTLYLLAAALSAPLLSACTDLDQTPLSSIEKNDFYQTEADLQAALYGVYQILSDNDLAGEMYGIYNTEMIFFNDLQSEYARRGTANSPDIAEIGNFAITPTNTFVVSTWLVHYTGINRANVLIDKAEANTAISDRVRAAIVGQAKFLRALYYFDLVRYYGDVPLVLHDGEGEGQPRTATDKVYEQIVADLKAAEGIPAGYSSLPSVASAGAATALLAKVHLVWAQSDTEYSQAHQRELFGQAVAYASKVEGKYKLLDRYCDNWSVDKKLGNAELIFTVEHKFGINRNVIGRCVLSTGFTNDKQPVIAALDNSLYDLFDANDQRRDASVTKRLYDPFTGHWFDFDRIRFRKYIDTIEMAKYSAPYISGQNTSSSVLRYAEVLLIKAEAENELNGPSANVYAMLDKVRTRVGMPAVDQSKYNTKDKLRELIRRERGSEFAGEGLRRADILRWTSNGKMVAETVLNGPLNRITGTINTSATDPTMRAVVSGSSKVEDRTFQTFNRYLPIPQQNISDNPKLEQNPGYAK